MELFVFMIDKIVGNPNITNMGRVLKDQVLYILFVTQNFGKTMAKGFSYLLL